MNIAYFIKPKNTVAFVYNDNTVRQVIEKMKFHGYAAIPVLTHDGRYFGTVTEGDLLFATYRTDIEKLEKIGISEIIKKDRRAPVSVLATVDELIATVTEQNFVPVIDDRGCFMGIVTRKDILRYFYAEMKKTSDKKS